MDHLRQQQTKNNNKEAIKNGQSKTTTNKKKTTKQKTHTQHNMCWTQKNTNNVNKSWAMYALDLQLLRS